MSQQHYTQTPNFVSSTSNDIDPRTRMFGFQQSLGSIIGNNGLGPEFDVMLTYSPTTGEDPFLFGKGVILGVCSYDKNSFTLNLDSGESYKVSENAYSDDDYFEIKQCKIKSFSAKKINQNKYRIIDINGNISELEDKSSGLCLPVKLTSPLGRSLTLDWDYDMYSRIYLKTVTDDNAETLYQAEYDDNNQGLTVTFLPGWSESYTLTFSSYNGYLNSITSSALPADACWYYSYEEVGIDGLATLTRIQTPTGLIKEAIYNSGLTTGIMFFPDDAQQPPLPAVTQLTVTPGMGQEAMITTYAPADGYFNNYLGWGAQLGTAWDPDSDNLYNVLDADYQYQTVVTQSGVNGGEDIVCTYTYNSYHLLLSTVTVQGTTTHNLDVTFYAEPGMNFDDQPVQFQFPKQQTETWADSALSGTTSRSEITQFVYDEKGNLTSQTSPEGTVTTSVYYSADGEADSADQSTGCPADPNGFTHWLKSQTVTPPTLNGYTDVPVRTSLYRYTSQQGWPDSGVSEAVLPIQETHRDETADLTLLVKLASHGTDSSKPDWGRVTKQDTTLYHGADAYTRSVESVYSYSVPTDYPSSTVALTQPVSEMLVQTDTFSVTDANQTYTLSGTLIHSRFTGQHWSMSDSLKNRLDLTYDSLGRVNSRTLNPGTAYETSHSLEHIFTIAPSDGDPLDYSVTALYTTHTDDQGNAWQEHVDGMGRPVAIKLNDKDSNDSSFYDVHSITYDGWGRATTLLTTDHNVPLASATSGSVLTTLGMLYDNWGQNYLSRDMNIGLDTLQQYEPVARHTRSELQVTSGSLTLGSTRTEYNEQELPVRVYRIDSEDNEYLLSSNEYDGLGRLRKSVEYIEGESATAADLQRVTQYSYDVFDRLATQTLPDGSVVTTTYAPQFSSDSFPNKITITDPAKSGSAIVAGERQFDILGRLSSTTCGGRTASFTYASAAEQEPATSTDSAGQTLSYSYDPKLGNAMLSLTGASVAQNFSYKSTTGDLLSVSEVGSQTETRDWSITGKLLQQHFTPAGDTERQASFDWTLLGQPVSHTDVGGNTQSVTYDSDGRVIALDDPLVTVDITYDEAGRVHTQTTTAKTGSDSIVTTLTYDDFDREIQRELQPSTGNTVSLAQSYWRNDLIKTRQLWNGAVIPDDNSLPLQEESFSYDARNRLLEYRCVCNSADVQPPVDGWGNPIASQRFTYDVLNNITACVTTLSDGSVNNTLYEFTNTSDPTQLTALTHSLTASYPARIELHYDANGRMVQDEAGRTLTYDEMGRLTSISGSDGGSTYGYDGLDQLVMQCLNNSDTRQLYYRGSTLVNEVAKESKQLTRFIPGFSGTAAVSSEEPLSVDAGSATSTRSRSKKAQGAKK